MAEILRLQEVTKAYGENTVIRSLDLTVNQGETLAIIGPSGAGKSTILRCINYLEPVSSGRIYFEGELFDPEHADIYRYRLNYGFVFQSFNLFPHLSVRENVTLAPRNVLRLEKAEADRLARELLDKVGLLEKIDSYPKELSGGQRQRVAIARALAMKPKVMLLDEITSALDPELVGEVLDVVSELAHAGMTILLVTHEMRFARDVAKRVVFFEAGSIVEDGRTQQIFTNPREARTKAFLNSVLR